MGKHGQRVDAIGVFTLLTALFSRLDAPAFEGTRFEGRALNTLAISVQGIDVDA